MPQYAEDGSGMTPVSPEQIEAKIPPASAHADAMERELDNAVLNHQEAVRNSAEADAALARARAAFDNAERDFAYDSPERKEAAEAWSAANREAFDKFKLIDPAKKQVRLSEYNLNVARYRVSYLRRLAAANQTAYRAAQARNDAATAWERTGMTDYNSPEYARFRDANERFRAAQRELSDRFWDQESPARGTDNTVPAPPQPSMPPTEPAPAPAGTSPAGAAAPGGCGGGGAASPAAQSVVGVVGAGAGAAGAN
jgi:hypothetical protein